MQDERWKDAMKKEIHALEENGTWILESLPKGKRAIDSKWVYKVKLRKSRYGIKQASRNWYQKFTTALLNLGFRQCKADYSLFIFKQDNSFVAALIYMDDVIVVGNDKEKIESMKNDLDNRFSIKDLGILKYFLGIEVTRTTKVMVLSQRKYTLDILEDCGFQGCRPSSFPIEPNLKLDKRETEPKVDSSRYRRMVGRRSRTGCNLLLGGAPVSWKTKKQSIVSRSSAEAEYRSMASTVSEVLWMRWILSELDAFLEGPTLLFCDNQAARHIANNSVFHERTKHVEMDCYFVCERVESKE
ncbi:putative reverse transcriptase, RNA-dependent DNA polymerase, LTR copia-type gag-polypeptide [Tanacetum coccineum]